MPNENTIKGLKLVAILLVAELAFFTHSNRSDGATSQDPPARLFEIVGMNVPLEQRVGVDDGAIFVVHFSGDTRGNLDACG